MNVHYNDVKSKYLTLRGPVGWFSTGVEGDPGVSEMGGFTPKLMLATVRWWVREGESLALLFTGSKAAAPGVPFALA